MILRIHELLSCLNIILMYLVSLYLQVTDVLYKFILFSGKWFPWSFPTFTSQNLMYLSSYNFREFFRFQINYLLSFIFIISLYFIQIYFGLFISVFSRYQNNYYEMSFLNYLREVIGNGFIIIFISEIHLLILYWWYWDIW